MHHPRGRWPASPAPLCSHCHNTHWKNICCNGSERLLQPACKSRAQNKPLFSTYIPVVTVPIAWHVPSWAVASGSSLHPVLGCYNHCQHRPFASVRRRPREKGRRMRGGRFLKRKETITGQWLLPIGISYWGSCLPPIGFPEMRNEITRPFCKSWHPDGCSSLSPFSSILLCLRPFHSPFLGPMVKNAAGGGGEAPRGNYRIGKTSCLTTVLLNREV